MVRTRECSVRSEADPKLLDNDLSIMVCRHRVLDESGWDMFRREGKWHGMPKLRLWLWAVSTNIHPVSDLIRE